jgi:hypothetical protein
MRFASLDKYPQSRFGQYVARYMTRSMEMLRLAGYVVTAAGAWFRLAWLIPLGLPVVLLGWLRGVIAPDKPSANTRHAM